MSPRTFIMMVAVVLAVPGVAGAEPTPVEALVANKLAEELPAGLSVSEVILPRTFALPSDARLEVKWKSPPRAGAATAVLVLRRGESVIKRSWCRVRILPMTKVAVLVRARRAGDTLMENDIQVVDRAARDVADVESVIGARLLVDAEKGAVVSTRMIAAGVPVGRGTPVDVQVRYGSVRVTTSGTLERDSRIGAMAWARLTEGGTRVEGRLHPNNVLSIEGGAP